MFECLQVSLWPSSGVHSRRSGLGYLQLRRKPIYLLFVSFHSDQLLLLQIAQVPLFCPAITDGSVGDMIYFHTYKRPGFIVDVAQVSLFSVPVCRLFNLNFDPSGITFTRPKAMAGHLKFQNHWLIEIYVSEFIGVPVLQPSLHFGEPEFKHHIAARHERL